MIKYFTADERNCFPESIEVGTEITVYDTPTCFKKTIDKIGPNFDWQIPAFSTNDIELIKNTMIPHYNNVWICVNHYHDLIGCIGFNK